MRTARRGAGPRLLYPLQSERLLCILYVVFAPPTSAALQFCTSTRVDSLEQYARSVPVWSRPIGVISTSTSTLIVVSCHLLNNLLSRGRTMGQSRALFGKQIRVKHIIFYEHNKWSLSWSRIGLVLELDTVDSDAPLMRVHAGCLKQFFHVIIT